MNKFYKIGGLILIIISIAISISSYKKFNTIQNGRIVEVDVVEVPISCELSNKTIHAYFRFRYNGKEYTKNIKGEYCETLNRVKKIKLKTNSDNSVFVFLDENLIMQYVSIILLFVVGLYTVIKKNRDE